MMRKILLMDDTLTVWGSMVAGCQACLARHGFECVSSDGATDINGDIPTTRDKAGERLLSLISELEPDGIVLDIYWGEGVDYDGFDIWHSAKELGLMMDAKMVVFMTQHFPLKALPELARKNGFSNDQVLFKNAQGNDAAVRWFCSEFNIRFSGCGL